jgi:hypothetical protein
LPHVDTGAPCHTAGVVTASKHMAMLRSPSMRESAYHASAPARLQPKPDSPGMDGSRSAGRASSKSRVRWALARVDLGRPNSIASTLRGSAPTCGYSRVGTSGGRKTGKKAPTGSGSCRRFRPCKTMAKRV